MMVVETKMQLTKDMSDHERISFVLGKKLYHAQREGLELDYMGAKENMYF